MATVATLFTPQMTKLTGNTGGGVAALLESYNLGGRRRHAQADIVLAAQASGTQFGLTRLPLPFLLCSITLLASVSLGTTTIAIGDANTTNLFVAAQTFTAVDTPTLVGKTAALGTPITTGYDSVTGNQVTAYAPGPSGGGLYEDITLLTAVAALPGAGTLRILFDFVID